MLLALAGSMAYLYDRYVAVTRYTAEHGQVTVSADTVSGLTRILVTNKGYALYVFSPDAASQVTCTGGCATAWPSLVVPAGDTAAAGAGVRPGLLGTRPGRQAGRHLSRLAAVHLPRRRRPRPGTRRRRRVLVCHGPRYRPDKAHALIGGAAPRPPPSLPQPVCAPQNGATRRTGLPPTGILAATFRSISRRLCRFKISSDKRALAQPLVPVAGRPPPQVDRPLPEGRRTRRCWAGTRSTSLAHRPNPRADM
jgi:hypothetical protein